MPYGRFSGSGQLSIGRIAVGGFRRACRLPLAKWTVPAAVLGGVVLIGGLLLVMNYNHPYSEVVRQYYTTTPIIPEVKGKVIDVDVKMNVPLKAGDILFKIDPEPFQDKVAGIEGKLTAAKKELKRSENLVSQGAVSEQQLDDARARVEDLKADLANAQFDLQVTEVTAPGDGYVTQLNLRPGMMVMPLATRPVMTFMHEQEGIFVGWFRQNSLLRIYKGDEAEVVLDAFPGITLKARVEFVFPATGEGQMQPSAEFMRYGQQTIPGRIAVA